VEIVIKEAPSTDAFDAAREQFFSGKSAPVKITANVAFAQGKSFDRPVAPHSKEDVTVRTKEVVVIS
jgi:hypothetical protein